MQFVRLSLLSIHVLAGAVWFGAMFYSLMVLHPRARSFFQTSARFEEFITFVASGARWKVLGGCLIIGISGVALYFMSGSQEANLFFQFCIIAKTVLFLLAVALFSFTSWVLWPARVLATPNEIPVYQTRFRTIAIILIVLVGLNLVLGIASSQSKSPFQNLPKMQQVKAP